MPEHKNLAAALLAFKAEVPPLPKDKVNPHFKSKYTPLDTIAEKVDPLLTKHGLVWTTMPGHVDGNPTLDYRLIHAGSGEELAGSMPLMLDRENSQGLGSALTYNRRYAKTAVLDLVADEDDDGNAASPKKQAPSQPRKATPGDAKAIAAAAKGLTKDQVKLALASLGIPNVEFYEDIPADKTVDLVKALNGMRA